MPLKWTKSIPLSLARSVNHSPGSSADGAVVSPRSRDSAGGLSAAGGDEQPASRTQDTRTAVSRMGVSSIVAHAFGVGQRASEPVHWTLAVRHGVPFNTLVRLMSQSNKFSARITQQKSQGASQAMLYATGMTEADMAKPQVGISSVWYEGNPCNMHLLDLAAAVREGVGAAGMVGMRFNTIGVSDGISMGTDGMSYSLQSRDLIADSIETVMSAQWYDANISIPGCDKNMPGCLMAMGRLNRPSIMVYGGTIRAGHGEHGEKLDVISAFQSYGQFIAGAITETQRCEIVRQSCPGAGACGGMYTANTMASAAKALGMSLPYSSSTPAEDPGKRQECRDAGVAIKRMLEMDLKPRDIMTRAAFENAMVLITVLGGSTNAVLHLIAIARSVGINLTLDDMQRVSDRVPMLADFKPSGQYVMEDLQAVGGTPAV